MPLGDVWGNSWGDSWNGSWAQAQQNVENTPGRIVRRDWWKSKPDPVVERVSDVAQARTEPSYDAESARIGRQIAAKRAESLRLRAEIARLDAELMADGVRRMAEQQALERQLLLAQQAALLVAAQEAVLLEEMEIVDIAFIAVVAVSQLQ